MDNTLACYYSLSQTNLHTPAISDMSEDRCLFLLPWYGTRWLCMLEYTKKVPYRDLKSSQQCCWGFGSSKMWHCACHWASGFWRLKATYCIHHHKTITMFLSNIKSHLPNNMMPHPRRLKPSTIISWLLLKTQYLRYTLEIESILDPRVGSDSCSHETGSYLPQTSTTDITILANNQNHFTL